MRGRTSGAPTHYLEHDQKALEVKASAPSDAQFVLCVKVPDERALLEVMETIRQSVSHMTAWVGQLTAWVGHMTAWVGQLTAWVGHMTAWVGQLTVTCQHSLHMGQPLTRARKATS